MSAEASAGERPELSILIPAWNEGGNIGPLLRRCHATLAKMGVTYEILVIDGGSVDSTVAEAEAEGAVARRQEGRGYGGALRTGFGLARGRYIQTMDSDLSHEPEVIEQLYAARERADVVIASRYVKGGAADMPLYRAILSRILNVVFTTVLQIPVKDISSGFRLYRGDVVRNVEFEASDFDVLEEILILIIVEGGTVTEVPFHYRPRVEGESHARLFHFALAYLKTLHAMWRLRRGHDHRSKSR